jgi:hypothetical protein
MQIARGGSQMRKPRKASPSARPRRRRSEITWEIGLATRCVLFSLVKCCEDKESGREGGREGGRAIDRASETESHNVLQAPHTARLSVIWENDLAEWTAIGCRVNERPGQPQTKFVRIKTIIIGKCSSHPSSPRRLTSSWLVLRDRHPHRQPPATPSAPPPRARRLQQL